MTLKEFLLKVDIKVVPSDYTTKHYWNGYRFTGYPSDKIHISNDNTTNTATIRYHSHYKSVEYFILGQQLIRDVEHYHRNKKIEDFLIDTL